MTAEEHSREFKFKAKLGYKTISEALNNWKGTIKSIVQKYKVFSSNLREKQSISQSIGPIKELQKPSVHVG